MGRKKKLFTGIPSIGGYKLKSRREARKITSKFHILNNKIEEIKEIKEIKEEKEEKEEEENKLKLIEEEINKLGGRNRYQQASVINTSYHKTSKWIISNLKKLGIYSDNKHKQLLTLEIGAINIQLHHYSGLNVRSIDVNSQHRLIEELDFFEIIPEGNYDLIVCSMVVNCVPSPELRGEMIARLSLHLKPYTGILCLILPTRCITQPHLSPTSSSSIPDDSLFRNLLQSLNLIIPSIERFPLLDENITTSTLPNLLTKHTPKLSFYILMHSTSIQQFITPSSNSLIPNSNLDDIQDWILSLPLEKQKERILKERDEVNENNENEKLLLNQNQYEITSNTFQNFISLIHTLKTAGSSQNQQEIKVFLSESGKEILRQFQIKSNKRNKKRKLVESHEDRNDNENSNSLIVSELGLQIFIPDKLLYLITLI